MCLPQPRQDAPAVVPELATVLQRAVSRTRRRDHVQQVGQVAPKHISIATSGSFFSSSKKDGPIDGSGSGSGSCCFCSPCSV